MAKAQAQKQKKSDFLTSVAKLKKGVKVGILFGAIGGVIALFYFLYYTPWQQEVSTLENEVKTLNSDLSSEQANLNKHKAIDGYVKPVEYAYNYLCNLFTSEDEIDGLLKIIAELGAQAGINTNTSSYTFKPRTVLGPQYAEIQFTMDIEASFLNLLRFLYSVSNFNRLINITSVSIGQPTVAENRVVMLRVKCQGSAYRMLTPDEVKLASDQAGKKR
jgi:Tfp pilus assembly protein PilO